MEHAYIYFYNIFANKVSRNKIKDSFITCMERFDFLVLLDAKISLNISVSTFNLIHSGGRLCIEYTCAWLNHAHRNMNQKQCVVRVAIATRTDCARGYSHAHCAQGFPKRLSDSQWKFIGLNVLNHCQAQIYSVQNHPDSYHHQSPIPISAQLSWSWGWGWAWQFSFYNWQLSICNKT